MIKLLLADDHPIFRSGLKNILESSNENYLFFEAGNGNDAFALAELHKPDLAILDVNMPVLDGFQVLTKIRTAKLPIKVLFLTMFREEIVFQKAFDSGVDGFMIKEDAGNDLITGVEAVLSGKTFVSSSMFEMQERLRTRKNDGSTLPSLDVLTPTERKIMKRIAEMKTSRQIAAEFFISVKTVNNHRTNIANKLELKGNHALLRFASENERFL